MTIETTDSTPVARHRFVTGIDRTRGTLTSLMCQDDTFPTDYLFGDGLGVVELAFRSSKSAWQQTSTKDAGVVCNCAQMDNGNTWEIVHRHVSESAAGVRAPLLRQTFENQGDTLVWTLEVRNRQDVPLEVGDLGLPLLFSTNYVQDNQTTYTQRVVRHSWVSGDGSFIVLTRPNGVPPFLVMAPLPGTRLEYFTRAGGGTGWEGIYTAFVHSKASGERETRGSWRMARTSAILAPAGSEGDTARYAFRFRWAADYDDVRSILVEEGLFDIQVAPGMTLPTDLQAFLSLRSHHEAVTVRSEFPEQTHIEELAPLGDARRYKITFSRLGENLLTVCYGEGRELYLEYFVTQPLETLIRKRAAFITANQQIRDPEKWYDGLFSLWDMQECMLRTPDDLDGLAYPYMVGGSDDPCLCKAPYLAAANLHYPNPEEIAAIEYYLEHFVWGKLQRTDREHPHPYGVYGVDHWYQNRNSGVGFDSGGHGLEHLWRTFDYPHLILLYFTMHRIAGLYPELVHYLDARAYLQRAYGTAIAFFRVPYNIKMGEPFFLQGWSDWAYKQGNFHELVIPELILSLQAAGMEDEARELRTEWEKKVTYFVYDHPYPFGSEMFFDSTGFESTHMVAKYGLENRIEQGAGRWYDKNLNRWYEHPEIRREDFRRFMESEIQANIAARGWLETAYYLLGSDLRQGGNSDYLLSYMTQMGGWSILDYGLFHADEPAPYLRLGYASYLASWALVNAGDEASGYGFWYPGGKNDGAAGWGFKAEQYGRTWMGRRDTLAQGRGIWRYDGEIDGGFTGGLRTAATVVMDDPLFGLIALGGTVNRTADELHIVPRDGLRQRLHLLAVQPALHIELNRDGFAADTPITISADLRRIVFTLENRYPSTHVTKIRIAGLPSACYCAIINDSAIAPAHGADKSLCEFHLPVGEAVAYRIVIQCTQSS